MIRMIMHAGKSLEPRVAIPCTYNGGTLFDHYTYCNAAGIFMV